MRNIWGPIVAIGVGLVIVLLALSFFIPSLKLAALLHKRSTTNKNRETVWLATGLPSGTYYALGKAIAEVGRNNGWNIRVCTSGGSSDNIGLVQEGSVSLALAQIDALDAVLVHQETPEISKDFNDLAEGCKRLAPAARLKETQRWSPICTVK